MLRFENQNVEFRQEYVQDIRKEVMAFINAEGSEPCSGILSDVQTVLRNQKQIICDYAKENGQATRKEVEALLDIGSTKAKNPGLEGYVDVMLWGGVLWEDLLD